MSDDWIPEERAQEYHQLLTALRSSSPRRVSLTVTEQAQVIARVRERLARETATSPLPDAGSLSEHQQSLPHLPRKRARTSTRLVANLLAALVVVGLIFGAWALFNAYSISRRPPAPQVVSTGSGPVARTQASGLEASMRVLVSGPYFLSELLPIDVSFTNHTQKPFGLDGSVRIPNNSIANACFPPEVIVRVTHGSNPSYAFPQPGYGCFQPYIVNYIQPGQTLTIHEYIPLTKSGAVTLTRGEPFPEITGDPLNKHWPTVQVQIQVKPQIPQNRALSLLNQKGQVTINTPAGAKAHLLVMQSITCDGYSLGDPGEWTPLSTNVLREQACPGAHRHWNYVVSAPGYAIVSGSQTA